MNDALRAEGLAKTYAEGSLRTHVFHDINLSVAEGETVISGVEHIERGYELMHEKFSGLGADVKRVTEGPAPLAEPSQALARSQG